MTFKRGVIPSVLHYLPEIEAVYRSVNYELLVTSLMDGNHRIGSLHYVGLAVDLRTRGIRHIDQLRLHALLREKLKGRCYVVLERDHFHVELARPGTPAPGKPTASATNPPRASRPRQARRLCQG